MPLSFNLIETRQISGVGTINVLSGAEPQGSRIDVLVFDLIRPATNRYRNFNWFPPRERIANITFRNDTIVVKSAVIEYDRQLIYDVADISGQTLVAVQCAYKGILQTFFNLGNALLLPAISVQNEIAAYSRLETPYNQVVVKCYADSAVAVSLYQLNYEQCGSDSGSFQSLTGLPSSPVQTAPGTPIVPSPPYDPNDANEPYFPNGLDSGFAPVISDCVLQYDYVDLLNSSFNGTFTITVPAVVPPLSLGAITYADFTGSPNNGPKESFVEITESNSNMTQFQIIDNSISAHEVSNLQIISCTPQ